MVNNMKKIEKVVHILIISLIIGIPLFKFITYTNEVLGNSYNPLFDQVYLLWLYIPLLSLVYIYGILSKEFKITCTDFLTYVLIFLAILSTVFSINVSISIIGENGRYEGLLSLLTYYLLFLNVKNIKNEKYKKNILKVFLWISIFQVVYSILQVYTKIPYVVRFSIKHMGMGLFGNPNFFGSYMVMSSLILLIIYLLKGDKKYLIYTSICFIGLCLASSTGPFLGFFLAFLFFIIVFFKKINFYRLILAIILLIGLFFLVDNTVTIIHTNISDDYNIIKELKNTKKVFLGNGRLNVWIRSLSIVKDYFWIGSGLDTFKLVYPQEGMSLFDKAHNVYLQMLITNGIFSLIAYCSLCLNIFIKGLKFKNQYAIAILTAFIGYSIQAFANISVIDVAPIFFIILGLCYTYIYESIDENKNKC